MTGVYRHRPRIPTKSASRAVAFRVPGPNPAYPYRNGLAKIYTGTGLWLGAGASPPVQIGDTFMVGAGLPGGYAVQANDDGTIVIDLGGDTSRQEVPFLLYRRISGTIEGPGVIIINEAPPVWNSAVSVRFQPLGAALSINLATSTFTTSPSGDMLVFTLGSGALPNGMSLSSGGLLSGTTTVAGNFAFTVIATDSTSTSTPSPSMGITVVAPPPPGPPLPAAPTLLAPPTDPPGAALDSQIANLQALVNANVNPFIQDQLQQNLSQLQTEAVDHYMATYWGSADSILAAMTSLMALPSAGNKHVTAQLAAIAARAAQVAAIQAAGTPVPNPLQYSRAYPLVVLPDTYWYGLQMQLIDYCMAKGILPASLILSTMTGSQTYVFNYVSNYTYYQTDWE